MKVRIFTLVVVCAAFWGINTNAFAQASGEYIAIADGDYNTVATWGISDGAGGTTAATVLPAITNNVWIPVGRSLTITTSTVGLAKDLHIAGTLTLGASTTSGQSVKANGNLTIESTGILTSTTANAGYVSSVTVGSGINSSSSTCTIQVDGQFGSSSATTTAGSGIRLFCDAGYTTLVTGSGKFNIARFQIVSGNARTQNIVIDMDAAILNNASATPTLSIVSGTNGAVAKTLTINAGKTVTFSNSGNALLHGQTGTAYPTGTGGNITYDIQGTLNTGTGGGLWLNTTSNTSSSTQALTLRIGAAGKLILGGKINTDVSQPATQSIVYDFAAGSTVEYSGATAVTFTGTNQKYMTVFSNLIMNNTGGVTLPVATTTNNLTLTAGTISLGANNLNVSTAISGGSSSSYVVTDGAGVLNTPAAASATTVFPIGPSTTAYAPASVNPATATTFAARVSASHAGAAPSGYSLNAEEWKLTPTAASSTVVSLTPTTATYNVGTVIFHWNGTSYDVIADTYNNGVYTATTSTFSNSFATGGSGTTGVKSIQNESVLVYSANGKVIIANANIGDVITVYTVSGSKVIVLTASSSQMSIELPNGLYIVNAGGKSVKVYVR
ncbi:beta strand repeat-containing protein [Parabacteroides sp. FAFU027]|uniref:beta strand repeat-containing protein n=1 Tax=Parabacteroides sp. FAFU027 TaxID=2922715 RepID=UPI001FAFF488|nr:DUF6383 domain-containing protein [Parabacteroides sp. FAFU027]